MPREDDTYGEPAEARERRRRARVTFGVVALLLFFAAWYALSYIRADADRREAEGSSTSPTCTVERSAVQVNVYNATSRDGLAARVAKDLEDRGFDVRTVANDPKRAEVGGVGQLRHGVNGAANAKIVGAHVNDLNVIEDARKREAVDVVLGPDFTTLVPDEEARRGEC